MVETATKESKEVLPQAGHPIENCFIVAIKEGNFVNNYNIIAIDLQDAITKCKKYCDISNKKRRFIHVRPFVMDLEKKVIEEQAV